ncbi:Spy/CpxP family protein refolding chaperone [Cupriavidus sp. 30B13]|uniref:Spy/CpxP family protein refolding chaperone n=1 Tax=Cupriavidus sp. 30B13 TaxID=3384241 RepID=UPI003B8F47B3
MKLTIRSFRPTTAFVVPSVAFLSMLALAGPAGAITATDAHGSAHVVKVASRDRIDTHISDLHARLQITRAQEAQWQKVSQVMRDNASKMDSLRLARIDGAGSMTAVGDLKSYGEIADAHAAGIRQLTPVFQELYDSMSDVQKKNADLIFQDRQHVARKN